MIRGGRALILAGTHVVAIGIGFGLGIYLLPILTAPEIPAIEELRATAGAAVYTGQLVRDLEDSDTFHWGEGTLYISDTDIVLEGRLRISHR